jgi:hypothetical protein
VKRRTGAANRGIFPYNRRQNANDTPIRDGQVLPDDSFDATQYFPRDAIAARAQFLRICEKAALDIHTIGEAEEDGVLIEAARIGSPDAPTVLVLTPGSNEGEGLCASAIECAALAGPVRRALPRDIGMLFIHAIAPKLRAEVEKPEFSVPRRDWEDALLKAAESRFEAYLEAKRAIDFPEQDEAVPESTHQTPDEALAELIEEHLGRARRIGVIDIRTGPGAFGRCDVIACAGEASPAGRRAALWFGAGGGAEPPANEDDDLDSELGAPPNAVPGPLAQRLITLLPPVERTAVVMEFGTYSLEMMLGGKPGRMFYPDDAVWQEKVWDAAFKVMARAMKVLSGR